MVEELKIVADALKGVTNGAVIGVCIYLVVDLLKVVTIAGFSFLGIKALVTGIFEPKSKE